VRGKLRRLDASTAESIVSVFHRLNNDSINIS
jgi:hypothetical protein